MYDIFSFQNQAYKYYNMKLSLKLLFLVIALAFYVEAAYQLKMSCTSDSTCSSGYAFHFTGEGFQLTECMDYPCSIQSQMTYQVYSCSTDASGIQCSTNTCFYIANAGVKMCMNENDTCTSMLGNSNYTLNMTCGNCQGDSNCTSQQKCNNMFDSSSISYPQSCSNQCYYSYMNSSMWDCTADFFGKPCLCCSETLMDGLSGDMGFCTFGTPFADDKIAKYAAGNPAWEQSLVFRLSLIILLLLVEKLI